MPIPAMNISTRVEHYLASEDEVEGESWEELVAILDEAIAAAPDAVLLGLRARMFSAAYEPYSAMIDLERAVALSPADRDAALALASLLLKGPDRLAESAVRQEKYVAQGSPAPIDDQTEEDYEDEEDDWDEADDERAAALAEHYAAKGTQSLTSLLHDHGSDLHFVHRVFDTVDELYNIDVWVHYTLLLRALATHPQDLPLRAREARFLAALASHCAIEGDAIPSGYWESVSGQRVHAITLERAVRCIDEVCATEPDPALLASKAELLAAIDHFPAAVDAYRQAAQLFDNAAAGASDEMREELAEKAEDARAQAELCQQGRHAINNANLSAMEDAIQKVAEMRAQMGMEAAPEHSNMAASLAELRGAVGEGERPITEEQRAEYRRLADSTAQKMVGMNSLDPIVLAPIATEDLEGGLQPWLGSIRAALEASGLTLGQQFDNPANNRMLGTQCQGQWWTDGSGTSALVVEAVKTITLKRLMTELSDNSLIMTADDRGYSFWQQGPAIDSMSVDRTTPIATMIGLHTARVARVLAARPNLRANRIDSLERLAEAENRARIAKFNFRLKEKVTEMEVRGMHVQFHDEFKALLEAALDEKLAGVAHLVH